MYLILPCSLILAVIPAVQVDRRLCHVATSVLLSRTRVYLECGPWHRGTTLVKLLINTSLSSCVHDQFMMTIFKAKKTQPKPIRKIGRRGKCKKSEPTEETQKRFLCGINMIKKLFDIDVSLTDMNSAIDKFNTGEKNNDKKKILHGEKNIGKLSEAVLQHLLQVHAKVGCRKLNLETGKSGIGSIRDFMKIYDNHKEIPIMIIGWGKKLRRRSQFITRDCY